MVKNTEAIRPSSDSRLSGLSRVAYRFFGLRCNMRIDRGDKHLRWLRFRLRSLLLVTAILCFAFAILGREVRRSLRVMEAVGQLRQSGGHVTFDWQGLLLDFYGESGNVRVVERFIDDTAISTQLRRLSNEAVFATVLSVEFSNQVLDESKLRGLSQFDSLTHLSLIDCSVTKEGWAVVSRLNGVRYLRLRGTVIGDSGMQLLGSLGKLEVAQLNKTGIGDHDLRHLTGMKDLRVLDLSGNEITDRGLDYVAHLPGLRSLHLDYTQVGDAGMVAISSLPNLEALSLISTNVGDLGVRAIVALPRLRQVCLLETKVTDATYWMMSERYGGCDY